MKANELRIGNYIFFDNEKIKVIGIIHNCIYWYSENGSPCHALLIGGEFRPIPIKGEWLLKLGFKTNDNIWFKKISKNEIVIEISSSGLFAIDNMSTIRCINHIHEIQNLYFAITGEELKL